ncbi:MAG TPA: aspartate-semialdehyde dehydrogenase, partial [Clostridiales bacterium]|nr:aspartate-semialdehyde dehydrogenase [Clostridiales bacterium]
EITALAASASSSGKTYRDAVSGRWKMHVGFSDRIGSMNVLDASDIEGVKEHVDIVFCAVDMSKDEIKKLEEEYARAEIPVISNNSANRWTEDVPMIIPEINAAHFDVIEAQKKRLGTKRGFITTKPNCSIQSYVPALTPLLSYGIKAVVATTFQAISGAGKTFETMPEIIDNVIPFISGEEEKSEKEPLKIWGKVMDGRIIPVDSPVISAQCIRVPVTNGHLAAVSVSFERKPSKEDIIKAWSEFRGEPQELGLPHAPKQFITYFEEPNRPQSGLDRNIYGGMGITVGRLREDNIFDFKFVCLSHNTLRGAAGGAVETAELLYKKGYFD